MERKVKIEGFSPSLHARSLPHLQIINVALPRTRCTGMDESQKPYLHDQIISHDSCSGDARKKKCSVHVGCLENPESCPRCSHSPSCSSRIGAFLLTVSIIIVPGKDSSSSGTSILSI